MKVRGGYVGKPFRRGDFIKLKRWSVGITAGILLRVGRHTLRTVVSLEEFSTSGLEIPHRARSPAKIFIAITMFARVVLCVTERLNIKEDEVQL